MRTWISDLQRDLPRLSLGGAWLFIAGSLFALLWLIGEGGIGSGHSYVFHTVTHGQDHSVWLLNYHGWLGAILLWAELLVVAAAAALTIIPKISDKHRRIGHGVLIGWNALWMLGSLRLGLIAPGFWTLQGLFLSALFACTVYRAKLGWNRPASGAKLGGAGDDAPLDTPFGSPPTGEADALRLLEAADVQPGPKMEELRSPRADWNAFGDASRQHGPFQAPTPRTVSSPSPGKDLARAAANFAALKSRLAAKHATELGRQALAAIRARRAAKAAPSAAPASPRT